jgi:hypothetical protein
MTRPSCSSRNDYPTHGGEIPLYKTDQEIAAIVGVCKEKFSAIAKVLERDGFPRKDPQFSQKRYFPAVKAWLDRRHGLGPLLALGEPDGKENWDYELTRRSAARRRSV